MGKLSGLLNAAMSSGEARPRIAFTELSVASASSTLTEFDRARAPPRLKPEFGAVPIAGDESSFAFWVFVSRLALDSTDLLVATLLILSDSEDTISVTIQALARAQTQGR